VPEETRRRILDAVAEVGYIPDRTARGLRTSKTYTVACIIPDITNPFYPAFARGIQDSLEQHGYDAILYNSDYVAEKERKYLHLIQQNHVDGAILTTMHLDTEDYRVLLRRHIAVVRMDVAPVMFPDLPVDVVYSDSTGAARVAVNHLLDRGHTRIAMLDGRDGPPRDTRLIGYRQALTERGIAPDEALIQPADFTEESGYHGMRALLALDERPTAVFAANDLMAIGALSALEQAGLRVPQDIAVMGFDDIPVARMVRPPLSTIAHFTEKQGQRAAELLLDRIDGALDVAGRNVEMPYRLIIRQST
jgi:LacI family transcriptional regulator